MPQIVIAALPEAQEYADAVLETLRSYNLSAGPLLENGLRAEKDIATARVLLLIAGDDWFHRIENHPRMLRSIGEALRRPDLLVMIVRTNGAAIPSATDLPAELRPLAYTTQANLSADHINADLRRLVLTINQHLRRIDGAGTSARAARTTTSRSVPWNLLIIISALVTGLAFIVVPDLRGGENAPSLRPPARSAAANAAIVNHQDGVHLGAAAALNGELAARGEALVHGVELALVQRPTVRVDGQSFSVDLLAQDASCSSEGGIQTAEMFVSDISMVGVIGPMCNTGCFSARSVYEESDFTVISPGCDAPGLAQDNSLALNRTVPNAASGAAAAAAFVINTLGLQRVAIISDEEIISTELTNAFYDAAQAQNAEVVARFSISSRTLDEADVRARIERADPEMVFFAGRVPAAVRIASAISNVPLMLGHSTDIDAFVAEAGRDAEGVMTYRLVPPTNERIGGLAEQYTAIFDTSPDNLIFAYSYDAANMLLDGIEAVGRVDVVGNLIVDRQALQRYIRQYQGSGVTGTLDCSDAGDCAIGNIEVMQIRDGVLATYNDG